MQGKTQKAKRSHKIGPIRNRPVLNPRETLIRDCVAYGDPALRILLFKGIIVRRLSYFSPTYLRAYIGDQIRPETVDTLGKMSLYITKYGSSSQ